MSGSPPQHPSEPFERLKIKFALPPTASDYRLLTLGASRPGTRFERETQKLTTSLNSLAQYPDPRSRNLEGSWRSRGTRALVQRSFVGAVHGAITKESLDPESFKTTILRSACLRSLDVACQASHDQTLHIELHAQDLLGAQTSNADLRHHPVCQRKRSPRVGVLARDVEKQR